MENDNKNSPSRNKKIRIKKASKDSYSSSKKLNLRADKRPSHRVLHRTIKILEWNPQGKTVNSI
ncbi:hypothetical protein JWG45_11180 [Leptospira sp. 201903070]|uniref:50S ribosomal protein L32 n=1 Tax=Leptospira ainlahdjerensis TaxID=2810033 RepID=A0ABS2UD74_9LEPT|nr:hypothetical protein [Leptospira ainlahdjerensis]MBM9577706.1 hypothetical protein [Leptospira ainlahdjerensis]MBM9577714.1 hypothetical protein [Leptospira ainlahdjerensis]